MNAALLLLKESSFNFHMKKRKTIRGREREGESKEEDAVQKTPMDAGENEEEEAT